MRDLSLVGAGAAWVLAEQMGVQPLDVMQILAVGNGLARRQPELPLSH